MFDGQCDAIYTYLERLVFAGDRLPILDALVQVGALHCGALKRTLFSRRLRRFCALNRCGVCGVCASGSKINGAQTRSRLKRKKKKKRCFTAKAFAVVPPPPPSSSFAGHAACSPPRPERIARVIGSWRVGGGETRDARERPKFDTRGEKRRKRQKREPPGRKTHGAESELVVRERFRARCRPSLINK